MQSLEDARHDLLLVIITALFIIIVTGLAVPTGTPVTPVVIS